MPINELLSILPYGTVVNVTLSGEFYCKFIVGNYVIQNALANIETDVYRFEYDITNNYYNIDIVIVED